MEFKSNTLTYLAEVSWSQESIQTGAERASEIIKAINAMDPPALFLDKTKSPEGKALPIGDSILWRYLTWRGSLSIKGNLPREVFPWD